MATAIQQVTRDGQAVLQQDMNGPWTEAALADDAVLAELLNVASFGSGIVGKAILARRAGRVALVAPNGASGSVKLGAFRAITGSRTTIADGPSALLNWSDVRSVIYAPTDDDETLGHAVSFAANSSGNPRIDLVYVLFARDQNAANVSRNVRAPGSDPTDPPVPTSLVVQVVQVPSIGVVTGAPGATPAAPSAPSDTISTGQLYIPLAYVMIPNGFGPTTTVLPEWIQMVAPMVSLSEAFGGVVERAPSALSSGYAGLGTWAASSGSARPQEVLPCTRRGAHRLRFGLNATTSSPTIANGGLVDGSIDWRGREFTVTCSYKAGATQFAYQHGATSGAIPQAGAAMSRVTQEGQSFEDDSVAVFGGSSLSAGAIFYANNAVISAIPAGSNAIGLYVDLTSGQLKLLYQGVPNQLFRFLVEATDTTDNV